MNENISFNIKGKNILLIVQMGTESVGYMTLTYYHVEFAVTTQYPNFPAVAWPYSPHADIGRVRSSFCSILPGRHVFNVCLSSYIYAYICAINSAESLFHCAVGNWTTISVRTLVIHIHGAACKSILILHSCMLMILLFYLQHLKC